MGDPLISGRYSWAPRLDWLDAAFSLFFSVASVGEDRRFTGRLTDGSVDLVSDGEWTWIYTETALEFAGSGASHLPRGLAEIVAVAREEASKTTDLTGHLDDLEFVTRNGVMRAEHLQYQPVEVLQLPIDHEHINSQDLTVCQIEELSVRHGGAPVYMATLTLAVLGYTPYIERRPERIELEVALEWARAKSKRVCLQRREAGLLRSYSAGATAIETLPTWRGATT